MRTLDLQRLRARLHGHDRVDALFDSDTYSGRPHPLSKVLVPEPLVAAWAPFARSRALRLNRRERFDCVITSSPPESAHAVGRALARRGVAWVADLRDAWTFEPIRPPFPTALQRRLDERLERRWLGSADAVVCVSRPVADDLRGASGSSRRWSPTAGTRTWSSRTPGGRRRRHPGPGARLARLHGPLRQLRAGPRPAGPSPGRAGPHRPRVGLPARAGGRGPLDRGRGRADANRRLAGPDRGRRQPAPRAGARPAARRGRAPAARLAPAHPAAQLQAVRVPGEPGGRSSRWPREPRRGEWSRRRAAPRCPPTTWRRSWGRCGASPRASSRRPSRRRSARLLLPGRRRAHGRGRGGRRGVSQSPPLALAAPSAVSLTSMATRPTEKPAAGEPDGKPAGDGPPDEQAEEVHEDLHRYIAPLVGPEDERRFTDSGIEVKRLYDADDVRPGLEERLGDARRVPVHARHPPRDVPRPAVDDAPVRRLRDRRGDQSPLPLPDRARLDRPLDGLRPADPARPRLRRAPLPGRGGPHRGCDRHDRGHADLLRPDPARRGLDLDDDQRPGGDPAAALRAGRRGAGRRRREAARHGPERRAEGVRGAGQLHLPARGDHAADHRHLRVLPQARPEVEHDLDLRLPHPREGLLGGAGGRLHARQRDRLRRGRAGQGPGG